VPKVKRFASTTELTIEQSISMKRYSVIIYFLVLFLMLGILYSASFTNPPRSDYWSALYVFHQVDSAPGPLNLVPIINHDPWQDGTYRPLSHLFLYLEHRLFGAAFIWNHILHFATYCLSLLLIYFLARQFVLDKFLTAAFLAVYAVLFSHFDIVTWTFQIFITIGFSSCLLAFILYLKYLSTGKKGLLVAVGCLFLFSLFSYEGYALWPLSVLILSSGRRFLRLPGSSRGKISSSELIMLGVVYSFYIGVFFLTRSAVINPGSLPNPTATQILLSISAPFFNFFYTGILINLAPVLSTPIGIAHNIVMRGLLLRWDLSILSSSVIWGGGAVLVVLGGGAWLLYRRQKKGTLVILAFFLFLYWANFLTISLGRMTTNKIYYPFAQFRYQYVPNALIILVLLTVISRVFKPGRTSRLIICLILIPVLIFNILLVYKHVDIIRQQLTPLRILLANLRDGIERGVINEKEKVYLDDKTPEYFPPMCWNKMMAPFVEGTYQWVFPEEDMDYFSFSVQGATWITDAELGECRSGYWEVWLGKRDLGKKPMYSESMER